jgi:hypothetical protein
MSSIGGTPQVLTFSAIYTKRKSRNYQRQFTIEKRRENLIGTGVLIGPAARRRFVHRGLRLLAGTDDLVAAVSADRQRVVFWPSWDGRKPAAEVHVYGITHHRIADIAFA